MPGLFKCGIPAEPVSIRLTRRQGNAGLSLAVATRSMGRVDKENP